MTNLDEQYINLLRKILETGVSKDTRAGKVRSIFGEQIKIDLKKGFPLLTTKKVFYKGVFHELLWFLRGETNIKYLVDNGVYIWNDDAYRYYCTIIDKHNETVDKTTEHGWFDREKIEKVSKEEFIENVKKGEKQPVVVDEKAYIMSYQPNTFMYDYVYGDLGPVYGKQWRSFGFRGKDQIREIIRKLKSNPNDRRMLCVAYNPDMVDSMALPPCHVMFQFYTRELEDGKIGLSCMWTQRSCDFPLGVPFNIASYALLTCLIAKLVGMVPDMLIGSFGDCHIYENQIEGVEKQLERTGFNELPKLIINGNQKKVEDFKFEDLVIENYMCDKSIKFPLCVG